MVKSYTKLGLTDLADDAQRVLKQSFPQQQSARPISGDIHPAKGRPFCRPFAWLAA